MTDSERIAALETTVAELQTAVGDYHNKADMSVRPTELPNGEYPILWRQRQLGLGIDAVVAKVAALAVSPVPAQPAPVVQTPPALPSAGTIPGLSASQIARVIGVCNADVIPAWARQYAAIASDLAKSIYDYGNADKIEALKEVYYQEGGAFKLDASIFAWLNIVDQRVPTADGGKSNVTLPPGDPRWKYVSGSAVSTVPQTPVPSGDIAGIVQQLADTYNVHIARNVVSVGIPPDDESKAGLQVGGEAEAEVLGISNTRGTDGQNPGEVHKNTLSICANDGGMRGIQYGNWGRNGLRRNTTNRPMTIRALMDSMGEACWSVDPLDAGEKSSIKLAADGRMYGQLYYERVDWVAKKVVLTAFQPGWTVEVAGSSAYGDSSVKQL